MLLVLLDPAFERAEPRVLPRLVLLVGYDDGRCHRRLLRRSDVRARRRRRRASLAGGGKERRIRGLRRALPAVLGRRLRGLVRRRFGLRCRRRLREGTSGSEQGHGERDGEARPAREHRAHYARIEIARSAYLASTPSTLHHATVRAADLTSRPYAPRRGPRGRCGRAPDRGAGPSPRTRGCRARARRGRPSCTGGRSP